ncbi:MAG: class I SAM-dependent methyltransferase, partial [Planctomycetota bacterium]
MNYKKPKAKLNLDVGCGENCQEGFIGVDKRNLPGVEVVHDIEIMPWPLEGGCADIIMMSHLVEHIKPWLTADVIDEAWRVLKDDGVLFISTPYAGSFRYFQDPTHCNPWNEATIEYFVKGTPLYDVYKPRPWSLEKRVWHIHGDLEFVL